MITAWSESDPWLLAATLGVAMAIGGAAGWWRGRSLHDLAQEKCETNVDGAVISLLSLLLAFTFSMALMKHEGRRLAVVADSNAIGDFSSCAGLLDDSFRTRLRESLRNYVELRLSMSDPAFGEASFEQGLTELEKMQNEIHAIVKEAVQNGTPIAVPLVTTFNAMTSAHGSRVAAVRDRLPMHAVLMLVFTSVLTVVLMGKRYGAAGERRYGAIASYIAVVCLVVWVTLDLDQPRRGWITVSQEPMQRLLQSLQD
jgi:hypothetical protein